MIIGGLIGANGCPYGTMSPPLPRPMFNSSPLSIALKPKMEPSSDMGINANGVDRGLIERPREDGHKSRSGSDNNLEVASADESQGTAVAAAGGSRQPKRKKYHRHTPFQIQELEAYFQVVQHPDEKQRLELGRRLSLNGKQVKYWFQNRRTQLKTQAERSENSYLKSQNEELLIENIRMKEALRNPQCGSCGGPAILGELNPEEHNLRVENAQLKDQLNRANVIAQKFLGRSLSMLPAGPSYTPPMPNSGLQLGGGMNGYDLGSFSGGLDPKDAILNSLPMLPMAAPILSMPPRADVPPQNKSSSYLELAMTAMDELIRLARVDELWVPSLSGGKEALDNETYSCMSPCLGMRLNGFVSEATRESAMVLTNSLALVDTMMDVNHWIDTFPCLIGRASVIDVVGSGASSSRSSTLLLMQAELLALSPLVPIRHVKFLRYCKNYDEGLWAVVDVSADGIQGGADSQLLVSCRRLPSGCIMQDQPDGYTKVTWVEHTEYDERVVHHIYRPLISSGMAFGAPRWLTTLQRQCDYLAVMMSASVSDDHSGVTPTGRRSMVKLAQKMIRDFCAVVCGTMYSWQVVPIGNLSEDTKLMIRGIGMDSPGKPPVLVLAASTSMWMPVAHQRLFDFLLDQQMRGEWDELSHTGPMQEMVHIPKGHDRGNSVSLLRATASTSTQTTRLVLQETQTDQSGSLIVYSPVDLPSMQTVTNGGDASGVNVLASGFAMAPDGLPGSGPEPSHRGKGVAGGCLLTLGIQMLITDPHMGKLTMESVDSITSVISRRVQRIERWGDSDKRERK